MSEKISLINPEDVVEDRIERLRVFRDPRLLNPGGLLLIDPNPERGGFGVNEGEEVLIKKSTAFKDDFSVYLVKIVLDKSYKDGNIKFYVKPGYTTLTPEQRILVLGTAASYCDVTKASYPNFEYKQNFPEEAPYETEFRRFIADLYSVTGLDRAMKIAAVFSDPGVRYTQK